MYHHQATRYLQHAFMYLQSCLDSEVSTILYVDSFNIVTMVYNTLVFYFLSMLFNLYDITGQLKSWTLY